MQEQHDERCRVIFRFVFKCFKCLCEQSFFRFNVDPVCEDLWLIYKINLQMLKTDQSYKYRCLFVIQPSYEIELVNWLNIMMTEYDR